MVHFGKLQAQRNSDTRYKHLIGFGDHGVTHVRWLSARGSSHLGLGIEGPTAAFSFAGTLCLHFIDCESVPSGMVFATVLIEN